MKKILAICLISHERPHSIEKMLSCLEIFKNNKQIEIVVADNSKKHKSKIKSIINKFDFIKLINEEGVSQYKNYINGLANINSKYVCFFHDDDLFSINIKEIEELIYKLKNNKNYLFHFRNASFTVFKPYKIYHEKKRIPNPYSLGSFPFRLPVFPSWIYPYSNYLTEEIRNSLLKKPFGKYSDIYLVERMLEKTDYKSSQINGTYVHIKHDLSDSNRSEYKSRLKLMIHTFQKLKKRQYFSFIVYIMSGIFKVLKKRILKFLI